MITKQSLLNEVVLLKKRIEAFGEGPISPYDDLPCAIEKAGK